MDAQTNVTKPATPTPRYRCGFPGCSKRYASTDGVRKHARKSHTQWLRDVDEQSSSRDQKIYGSKPSTYCVMEVGSDTLVDDSTCHGAASSENLERQPLRTCQLPHQNHAFMHVADIFDPFLPITSVSLLTSMGSSGCKRTFEVLENARANKRPMLDPWANAWAKPPQSALESTSLSDDFDGADLEKCSDTSSDNGVGSSDFCSTPLTVPFRPLAGNNNNECPSPFELSDEPEPPSLTAAEHFVPKTFRLGEIDAFTPKDCIDSSAHMGELMFFA